MNLLSCIVAFIFSPVELCIGIPDREHCVFVELSSSSRIRKVSVQWLNLDARSRRVIVSGSGLVVSNVWRLSRPLEADERIGYRRSIGDDNDWCTLISWWLSSLDLTGSKGQSRCIFRSDKPLRIEFRSYFKYLRFNLHSWTSSTALTMPRANFF